VKTCSAINPIKQLLPKGLPSPTCQNQHRAFNFQASAIVYRAVWLCRVPTVAKLCLESSTFEFYGIGSATCPKTLLVCKSTPEILH